MLSQELARPLVIEEALQCLLDIYQDLEQSCGFPLLATAQEVQHSLCSPSWGRSTELPPAALFVGHSYEERNKIFLPALWLTWESLSSLNSELMAGYLGDFALTGAEQQLLQSSARAAGEAG